MKVGDIVMVTEMYPEGLLRGKVGVLTSIEKNRAYPYLVMIDGKLATCLFLQWEIAPAGGKALSRYLQATELKLWN